jgi:hypothetical protein
MKTKTEQQKPTELKSVAAQGQDLRTVFRACEALGQHTLGAAVLAHFTAGRSSNAELLEGALNGAPSATIAIRQYLDEAGPVVTAGLRELRKKAA